MKNLEETAKLHKALGEPIRLRIVQYLLKEGQCTCICDLSTLLRRDQSVIFRHIQILKEAGVLDTRKEAKYLMCCIKDKKRIKRMLEDTHG
ncbi:MAG: ArsR family transcriptional regulator [Nanoarchaeota archaeon]